MSKLDQIYDPTFVAHSGGKSYSLEYDNASTLEIRTAFPDIAVSVSKVVGEGDLVAVYWSATGTNTAAGAGLPGNGRKGSIEGMTIFRFLNGRIVEEWSVTDMLSLIRQLGVIP